MQDMQLHSKINNYKLIVGPPGVSLKHALISMCCFFIEWKYSVSDEKVSTTAVLQPKPATRRMLPTVSW